MTEMRRNFGKNNENEKVTLDENGKPIRQNESNDPRKRDQQQQTKQTRTNRS